MIKSIIVAVSSNNVIGKSGKIPWYLPEDLKYFKKITTGHTIIMGRKTHESIGKALPNRTNIIITRQPDYLVDGCLTVNSIEEAISKSNDEEIFFIGGSEIYKETINIVDRIYLTKLDKDIDGDILFPEVDFNNFKTISKESFHSQELDLDYHFIVLEKIK